MTAKRNYQKELDELIARNMEAGIRPRLLVHSCCAPCSSYVMEYLSRYFDLTMFFYNPNMDSREEYEKRAA
ncbi:MAG: epoxyqueuosine reductase QueH, partial [Lachnospiraceae bacterium]|nr:epoxyqueuosine reductase QueH [Lachnospiraceae bacterium]